MAHKAVTMVILLIFVCSVVEGMSKFGRCWKFGPHEEIPNIPGRDWYCLSEDENQYCLFFYCPRTYCNKLITPNSGNCRYCKGTCSYGGKVYNVGDSLSCLDGSNRCVCRERNDVVTVTKIGTSPTIMCKT